LITRRRIEKQLKKRLGVRFKAASRLPRPSSGIGIDDSPRTGTTTLERLPTPNPVNIEVTWDEEWEKNLWEAALARVKAQVKPKHYQIFDLYVRKEWSVKEVARALGVSAPLVYVAKHRVASRIKAELEALKAKPF
jgi:DNA-directed RNA polymerase specialized sigma24 family protein